ncbi:MAG TPA: gliding motility-associated C-terminal domain-containing protein, partial [Bacteroidia bacterium]
SNTYTICSGSSQTFTVSGASTYTWTPAATLTNPNTANPTASPTTTTVYNATGTNLGGCTNTAPATVTVVVNPLPTLTVTPNSPSICLGQGSATLTASGANSYTWSTTATTSSITVSPSSTQTYSVIGTDANGCISSIMAIATVSVNMPPTITINSSTGASVCIGGATTLTALNAQTYTWDNGTISNTNAVNPTINPTTYTVVGTDANGCIGVAMQSITVNSLPTVNINPSSLAVCTGNSATLTAIGAQTYTWDSGSTANPLLVNPTTNPTTYTVTGTDANGCIGTATQSITVNPAPTININATSPSICLGQGNSTLTASGANSYTWNTTATTASIIVSPSSTLTYSVMGTDASGCISSTSATTTITVNPLPTITITPNPTSVCAGATTTLTASGATTYTWNNGTTLNTNVVSPTINPTTYSVNGTDINGCKDSNTVSISVNQPPTAQTVRDTFVCKGSTTTLTETNSSYTYYWTGPAPSTATVSTSSSIGITQGGIYTLHTTNSCGDIPTTFSVTKDSLKPSFVASPTTGIVPVSVSFTNTSTGNTLTYNWNFGDGDNSTSINPTENYTSVGIFQAILTATDNVGCTDTASIKIKVNEIPTVLVIPNVFTPNGDNINDIFFITATGISNLDCKVYDRWGLLLHEWTGIGGGWDGKGKNGNYCTDGVYFYLITYDDNQGKLCKKDDYFELIR